MYDILPFTLRLDLFFESVELPFNLETLLLEPTLLFLFVASTTSSSPEPETIFPDINCIKKQKQLTKTQKQNFTIYKHYKSKTKLITKKRPTSC